MHSSIPSLIPCCFPCHQQGTADEFYQKQQLLPENFEKAAQEAGIKDVKVRFHEVRHGWLLGHLLHVVRFRHDCSFSHLTPIIMQGYDHSYYFISTFAQDHIRHAAKALGLL